MRPYRNKVFFLSMFFMVVFIVLGFRIYKVMVVESPRLRMKGFVEHFMYLSFLGERGYIFDAYGRVLAASTKVYSIFACPPQVRDVSNVALKISRVLNLPPEKIVKRLKNRNQFVWIKRRVSEKTAERVKGLKLKGIYMVPESRRYYPYRTLASNVLGFTGVDDQGLSGLEYEYDRVLRGTRRDIVLTKDASGKEIPSDGIVDALLHKEGKSIRLSIDAAMEYKVDKILRGAVDSHRAKAGCIIVVNPYTGAVVAMSNFPTFDPNKFSKYPPEDRINRCISSVFEPGSTFKPFVVAAGLDSGYINMSFDVYCRGSVVYKGALIRDWKSHGREKLDDIIRNSCNVGMVKVALKIPSDVLYNYFLGFGFGRPTGIDLPGETAGILPLPAHWYGVGRALVGIGQGISVSVIQLTMAMSAIANGGYLVKPYVVEGILDSDGSLIRKRKPKVLYRVISASTDRLLKRMLLDVVNNGTGKNARIKGYSVAGKTGTAQVPSRRGGYAKNRYVSSFVGFFPVSHPKFLVSVVIWEPHKGGYYGGKIAAPVFRRVATALIEHYKISP